jgi:hypothetical protein
MECDAIGRVRLAALTEEIDAIHFADNLFWRQKQAHTRAEVAEYQWRQERLEQIRGELARLGSATDVMVTTSLAKGSCRCSSFWLRRLPKCADQPEE